MINSLIKIYIFASELVKSLFLTVFRFVAWFFKNKYTGSFFIFLIICALSWSAGLVIFSKNIDQNITEIIEDSPEFTSKTDAIVVLTGGSERIKHALYLLEKGYAQKLFISGVHKEVKLYELLYLHGYNVNEIKILRNKIELGYSASDTIENAEEIADWVNKNNIKSIRLVTSNYHIKRAMLEIQDKLPDIKIIAHGVIPLNIRIDRWWDFAPSRKLIISEYNKYILANVRVLLD
jgi:uncharacterized SAM-binding protein YcdF (DUF218 family)